MKEEKKAWIWFSRYIRLRDSDEYGMAKCCTCSHRAEVKYMDAGHFISRGKKPTKFSEENVNTQCKGCNGPKSGNQFEHSLFIDKKYGKGTSEKLLVLSRQTIKRSKFDYQVLAEHYKGKVNELLKEKNIEKWW